MSDPEIITLLREIKAELADLRACIVSSPPEDERLWDALLLHEYASGSDLDGNGLIYGHSFLFNQIDEYMPPSLRGLQNEYKPTWAGKRLTIIEYIQSLPDDKFRNRIINWMELARGNRNS